MSKCTKYFKSTIFCLSAFLSGCDTTSTNEPAEALPFLEALKIGEIGKISEFSDESWDLVCVLVSYQGILNDVGDERLQKINEKIPELGLEVDEGHWNLLRVKGDVITAQSIDRSKNFEIKQGAFNDSFKATLSDAHFSPSGCTDFEKTAFFKYEKNNRTYITWGEEGK